MKRIVYLLAFCLLTACYQEVDLHVPFEGSKMVLEGYVSPGKGLDLKIKKSFDPYEYTEFGEDGYWVNGARTYIYQAGQLIDSCRELGDGRYLSMHPEYYSAGGEYEVRINAPGLGAVYVEDIRIPEETLVDTNAFTFRMHESMYSLTLTVSFINPDHYVNYIGRSWHDSHTDNPLETWIVMDEHIIEECEGDLIFVSNKCETGPFEAVFSSTLKKRTKPGSTDREFLPKSYVYFEVGQVDARFRDYVESATAPDEPFIEPKLNPGNVDGGYGYIVGWNPVGFTYKLK